jgi:hypothetical protein
MQRRYYNADSLERSLHAFEKRFGLDSETFLAAHTAGDEDVLKDIPRFLRHSWASFYLDWQRLREDDLGATVEHELELV